MVPSRFTLALSGFLVVSLVAVGACAPSTPTEPVPLDTTDPPAEPAPFTYLAGVGRSDVSPGPGVPLGGYGLCSAISGDCRFTTGVRDPLNATAVALSDNRSNDPVVLVAVDSVGLLAWDMEDVATRASEALAKEGVALDPTRVIIGASHAHSAPDSTGLWSPTPDGRDEAYHGLLMERLTEAVIAAVRTMEPADLTWGTVDLPPRHDDLLATDDALYAIHGRAKANDTPLFTLVRWSAHPTVYGSGNNLASADYLAGARAVLESELGAPSLLINGSLASVYPERVDTCERGDLFPDGDTDPDVSEADHIKTSCTGASVAELAIEALQEGQPLAEAPIQTHTVTFGVEVTNLLFLLAVQESIIDVPDDLDVEAEDFRYPSRLTWLRLGELDFVSVPGEASPSFSQAVLAPLQGAGRQHTAVLGMAQDWLGYLLTPAQYGEPDFDYHQTLSVGEGMFDSTVEAAARLYAEGGALP